MYLSSLASIETTMDRLKIFSARFHMLLGSTLTLPATFSLTSEAPIAATPSSSHFDSEQNCNVCIKSVQQSTHIDCRRINEIQTRAQIAVHIARVRSSKGSVILTSLRSLLVPTPPAPRTTLAMHSHGITHSLTRLYPIDSGSTDAHSEANVWS